MAKYYKIITVLIGAIFYLQDAHAQADSVKAFQLKNRLIDSLCTCMSRRDTNSVNNLNEAEAMLSECLDKNLDLYITYIEAAGNDLSNMTSDKTTEIANYIASQVYDKCAVMKTMINHVNNVRAKRPN